MLKRVAILFFLASAARATSIGPNDFHGSQTVQTFETLQPNQSPYQGTLDLGGDIYATDNGLLAFGTSPGNGTLAIFSQSDLGFINIQLVQAVNRVGLELSTEQNWSLARLSAFDSNDTLLGSVDTSGAALQSVFLGFQSESGLIKRIRVDDLSENGVTISMDNLTRELDVVPVPTAAPLFISAIWLLGWLRRKV
jgi:hypothetical protein